MMIVSSITLVTSLSFISATGRDTETMLITKAHAMAQSQAEKAAHMAMWRIENTDPATWSTSVGFSESNLSVSFDSFTNVVTAVGYYGSAMADTIKVTIKGDTITTAEQLDHIIVYKKDIVLHEDAQVIHGENHGPIKQMGWRKTIKMDHKLVKSKKWYFQGKKVKGSNTTYVNMLTIYNGDQVFTGEMADGLHFVKGAVELNAVTLNGMISTTETITFVGNVTINALQVPVGHDEYPAYFPAVAAIRHSNSEQDVEDWAVDIFCYENSTNITINGLIFSRRKVRFQNATINGLIIAKDVDLGSGVVLTYDRKYAIPPLPQIDAPPVMKPRIVKWNEKRSRRNN